MSTHAPPNKPKYKVGESVTVRDYGFFGDSPRDRVMLVEEVSPNHGGPGWHRYYGSVPGRGLVGAYEDEVVGLALASSKKAKVS